MLYNTRSCLALSLDPSTLSRRLWLLVRIGLRKDVLDGLVHCGNILAYKLNRKAGPAVNIARIRVGSTFPFNPRTHAHTHTRKARLTRVNGISILIRNLNAEFLLDRHHYLHSVEAVQAKVVGKVSSGLDLFHMENAMSVLGSIIPPYSQEGRSGGWTGYSAYVAWVVDL